MSKSSPRRRHSRPAMGARRRRRRGHDVLIVLLLGVLAVAAVLTWIAEHLALLAVIAAVAAGAFYLGRHGQRRARPGQAAELPPRGWPEEPAAARAVPAATLPLAGNWDKQQSARLQAGPDRDSLIAMPMSGARDLWGPE